MKIWVWISEDIGKLDESIIDRFLEGEHNGRNKNWKKI
jgi:hypothetical protein